MSESLIPDFDLPWRPLPFRRIAKGEGFFPMGLTLDPTYPPWVDGSHIDAIPTGQAMAVVVLSPARTMVSGLRITGHSSSSSRVQAIPGPPSFGSSSSESRQIPQHHHVWAVPLDALEREDLGLEVQCHPDVPELLLIADVVDEEQLKVLEEFEPVFKEANRRMLILVTYLLNLRIRDANNDRHAPESYRAMRHSFLAFDFVTAPTIQSARCHFKSQQDLVDSLKECLQDDDWNGDLEPQVDHILKFFFAEENARFANYVDPLTSLLYDRIRALTANDGGTVSTFSELRWSDITHPDRSPQAVAIWVSDYINRAFEIVRKEPLPPEELGMAHPADLVEFARGGLALGFQYEMGESVLNCVPNSIFFLMICDLSILVAEHFERANDQASFSSACRRARLALAAETVYLKVYKPLPTADGEISIESYTYQGGPSSDRVNSSEVEELIRWARELPDHVATLRDYHLQACETATRSFKPSSPAEA